MELSEKLEDWKKLRIVGCRVRDLRGDAQHKAYQEFIDKSKAYVDKYHERFNLFKKPNE